jgi:hypothetical protein
MEAIVATVLIVLGMLLGPALALWILFAWMDGQ